MNFLRRTRRARVTAVLCVFIVLITAVIFGAVRSDQVQVVSLMPLRCSRLITRKYRVTTNLFIHLSGASSAIWKVACVRDI